MTDKGREFDIGQYRIQQEPFYAEVRGEVGLFTTAAKSRMPVMLKGPTGCGKTRFVQYMAYRLGRPLITVACHEDLTGSDLVGRYLLKGQDTVWVGPKEMLTIAATFDMAGEYVWHCHILSHEDNEMMRPFEVVADTLV